MNPDRLDYLIHAHLDLALTTAEAAELSACLARSATARQRFWALASLHGALPEAAQLSVLASVAPEASRKIVALPSPRRWPGWAAFAAAACLALAAVWLLRDQTRQDRSAATLVRAPGAVWENRGEIAREARLLPGRYRLKAGAAQLRFRSGARLILEAPAEIDLLDGNAVKLLSGQASGFVPPEARGFRVVTPALTLVDLGTAFGLKVPPSGPAEAHVFEGEVVVTSKLGGERNLVQGEAVRLSERGYTDIPLRADDFLTDARLTARDSAIAQRRLAEWRDRATRLSRDPATLVHFTCEGQERYDTVLHNAAHGRQADTHTGILIGATWAEGRWPGKSALAFRQPGDRVRFEVPGRYPQLTLLASVCLDALPNEFNALLMTENHALGDLRWFFDRTARLSFGLRTGPASDDRRFEYAATTPVFDEATLGRWATVATVLDTEAGTISHYLDGEPAEVGILHRKTEALLGALELGNWGIQPDDPRWTWTKAGGPAISQRHFAGRIDQFALLGRALTPEEIRTYSK
jgi:hypothetical protein